MTEFRGITTGKTIITKNNMNNIMVDNKIEIDDNNGETKIVGIVKDVVHLISKWRNNQGLERSTHDIIIDVEDKTL